MDCYPDCLLIPIPHTHHETLTPFLKKPNRNHNPIVVICGETGCGKTTQVPQFLFEGAAAFPNPKTVYLYCPDRRVHYLHHKYCPWSSALLTSQVDCYLP